MRSLVVLFSLAIALLPLSLSAQSLNEQPSRRPGKKFWISVAVLGAATFADAFSSRGRVERNPLLQNEHGRFSAGRALVIKSTTAAGLVGLEMWMMHRNPGPGTERVSTFTNYVSAGIYGGTAIYNSQNGRSGVPSVPGYMSSTRWAGR